MAKKKINRKSGKKSKATKTDKIMVKSGKVSKPPVK